jgi:thiol-disulfide isomerase/thioredoxin
MTFPRPLWRQPSERRAFLLGLAGAALVARPHRPLAREAGPPPFYSAQSQFVMIEPRESVAQVVLRRPDGGTRPLASYAGKALLLNFWASWCAACRRELPMLERLQARVAAEPFRIAALSIDRDVSRANTFMAAMRLTRLEAFVDPSADVASADPSQAAPFRIYGLPISYVVDRHSRVAGYLIGEGDWASEAGLALLRYFGED